MEYGNYHSYTFTIDRGFDNGLTENLLLSLQNDGSYKAVLITYDLTDAEKLALSNSELISLSNTPSFEYINDQALVTNLLSRNASEECFAFTQIYNLCCHNQHTELDIINGQNCVCDIQPTGYVYEITYSAENCENNGGSNDNDDGTYTPPDDDDNDTSTDNNDNGEGSNSGGNGNDTGNNTGTGNDDENPDDSDDPQDCLEIDFEGNCIGDVTSPIIPIETKDCTELKKNSENATFKLQMGVLKTAVLGDTEKSFGIYNGTHFNPPVSNPACGPIVEGDEGNSGVINRHPNLKATAHNHLKNAVGDRKHIGTFSDDDIYDFSKISEWSDDGVSPILKHELAYYLVCDEGNYALKVNDQEKLNVFSILLENRVFAKEIKDFYKKNKMKHGKPKKKQNIGFLKLMGKYDIGIDLYEADANFENWKKLELNDNENDIINTDC
ncbi:hypothetical protein HSX10_17315 [Winogradskyella undariae]|uniref:hypothetical protein n=1 Tax=Winogradskyella undariae TaxID=1285465 RepID=UPI00156B2B09|nr:hypothetical protein [Winogradskyella undariae]NRR93336.1 hypothetical protein [Winogradskyella undariae]